MQPDAFIELPGQCRDADALHELFHENTKLNALTYAMQQGRFRHYLADPRLPRETAANRKTYRGPSIALAPPRLAPMSLAAALSARASFRAFDGQALQLEVLGNILGAALATTRSAAISKLPGARLHYRPYPSGGALYPVETYVLLLNIAQQDPAVCHYDPIHHRLDLIAHAERAKLCTIAADPAMPLAKAAAVVIFSAVFQRSTTKYAARGYRLALLEAGHAAQNLLLCAAAEAVGSLAWAAYFDERIDSLLGLDGVNESVVAACLLGGSPQAGSEEEHRDESA